jgi:hypothetical protein
MTKAVHNKMNTVKPQVNPEIFRETMRERIHSETPVEVKIPTVSLAAVAGGDEHQMMIHRNHVVKIAQRADRRDLKAQAVNDNQHVAVAADGKKAVEVIARVVAVRLFLVWVPSVKMMKKVLNFLVRKMTWRLSIVAMQLMRTCYPKAGSTVFAMCRAGSRL